MGGGEGEVWAIFQKTSLNRKKEGRQVKGSQHSSMHGFAGGGGCGIHRRLGREEETWHKRGGEKKRRSCGTKIDKGTLFLKQGGAKRIGTVRPTSV